MLLGGLAMGLTKIRLGNYIERSTENNSDLKYGVELITGVNSQGVFAFPKGNTQGVDLKPYKIVKNGAFVYNPTRLDLGSLAYRTEGLCIVSHLYMVFYLNEKGKKIIDPMYLYMYFQRREFCREVTFRNFGSQRPEFNFNDMSDIIIPLPDIETQQKYVDVYNAMVANQQAYEQGLEDLKLTCDAYIEQLRHEYPSVSIKELIAPIDERNTDSLITDFYGININKEFMPTVANTNGVNSKNYKIVKKNRFVFSGMQTGRDKAIRIGLYSGDAPIIVSPAYTTFEIASNKILPEYFFMLFRRKEMDRLGWFLSDSSVRSNLDWERFCEITIVIPPIKVQQYIVNIFTVYQLRQEINEQLKSQIKDICPILIKGSLEEAMRI